MSLLPIAGHIILYQVVTHLHYSWRTFYSRKVIISSSILL